MSLALWKDLCIMLKLKGRKLDIISEWFQHLYQRKNGRSLLSIEITLEEHINKKLHGLTVEIGKP